MREIQNICNTPVIEKSAKRRAASIRAVYHRHVALAAAVSVQALEQTSPQSSPAFSAKQAQPSALLVGNAFAVLLK